MPREIVYVRYPELVFGLSGPIGIRIDELCETLKKALSTVNYNSHLIKITDEIKDRKSDVAQPSGKGFHEAMAFKMDHANALCRRHSDAALLMRYAVKAIRRERDRSTNDVLELDGFVPFGIDPNAIQDSKIDGETVRQKTAYIVRQLKRPDEVKMMKMIYGKQFILISAYGTELERKKNIEEKIRRTSSTKTSKSQLISLVEDLIQRDMHEGADEFGQHLRDAYYLADMFVDGIHKGEMEKGITRFINALFGKTDIAPTKDEFGLHMASSASLRSSDLSRQVGAAIMSVEGDLLAQGCNEVPKAFGGTYWDTEEPDHRDVKLGDDPNELQKYDVLKDILEKLDDADMLSAKAKASSSDIEDILLNLTSKEQDEHGKGCLKDALVMDLTEYGRVVHAEMNAICDAARLGRAIGGAVLYCTTFPCHNCTKHILSAGVSKVVYLEPYPKSKAQDLHYNEIKLEVAATDKVAFLPFMGIAPPRFRNIFLKGKRKKGSEALTWVFEDEPLPMIDILAPSYLYVERAVITDL